LVPRTEGHRRFRVEPPSVEVRLLSQPDRNARAIGDSLNEALAWSDVTRAWFAVAWAKRSGLTLIESAIRRLRARRHSVRALIGIDQHGGTEEALQLALAMFSEARIYHDTAAFRTFHPKLYVVEGHSRARVIVGSGNLTEGGLETNYELALETNLDLTATADSAILDDLRGWFDARWNDGRASRRLTRSLITRLIDDPAVVVVPEAAVPQPPRQRTVRAGSQAPGVFGPPVSGLRQRQRRPRQRPESDASDVVAPAAARPHSVTTPTSRQSGRRSPSAAMTTDLVLVAGLPVDRPGQAGFNRRVVESFFGVSRNGDQILAEAVDRTGAAHGMRPRRLVFPSGSNQNHRFELRDPEGRTRGPGVWPVLLVRRLGAGRFRYLYLYPGDRGYAAMRREMMRREGIGSWRRAETKRVSLSLAEVLRAWPGCPL
jgi:HKD family nuclease